ncbi:hypothetical protein J1N35_011666 [Gossypium stocksii]|uniref:Aminotransferase-like plant mobile domain-containing protein n=1 Tax=Gossypium stocksii TaxID=47602 RepID=A0A9D3W4M8_9ROSI|nr:hypothetical protein J1N35_011666 [Gossypium stocksii]
MGFLNTSCMLRGCKLDHTLINTLVERWRPKTHNFHLPCNKCTITLEDVALQLHLLVDRSVITREMIIPSKEDLYVTLLEKVSNKFDGGWILMNWLAKNFNKLPTNVTEVVKEQYARALILKLIGGILIPDKSCNLVHIRWNHGLSYMRLPKELEDIRLLLDQCSEAEISY